jgi:hypothetical protein
MGEQRFLCGRHGIYEGESCVECDGEELCDNGIRADSFEEAAKMLQEDKWTYCAQMMRAKAKELRNE